MARWNFSTRFGTTYTFEVNPNAGGSPRYLKRMEIAQPAANTTQPTAGNQTIIFEGRPEAPTGQIQGVTLSADQFTNMSNFFHDRAEIIITDDLGRVFTVAPIGFSIRRAPKRFKPWRCTWTMDFILLDPAVI